VNRFLDTDRRMNKTVSSVSSIGTALLVGLSSKRQHVKQSDTCCDSTAFQVHADLSVSSVDRSCEPFDLWNISTLTKSNLRLKANDLGALPVTILSIPEEKRLFG